MNAYKGVPFGCFKISISSISPQMKKCEYRICLEMFSGKFPSHISRTLKSERWLFYPWTTTGIRFVSGEVDFLRGPPRSRLVFYFLTLTESLPPSLLPRLLELLFTLPRLLELLFTLPRPRSSDLYRDRLRRTDSSSYRVLDYDFFSSFSGERIDM